MTCNIEASYDQPATDLLQLGAPARALTNLIYQYAGTDVQHNVWMVQFKRLLNSSDRDANIIAQIKSQDALHAVVGLYDVSLSDMETEIIYSSVTDPKAHTLVILRTEEQAICSMAKRLRRQYMKEQGKQYKSNQVEAGDVQEGEVDDETVDDPLATGQFDKPLEEDKLMVDPGRLSDFRFVYTDSEPEEEDEEDDDDDEDQDEDFSIGYHGFIKSSLERKSDLKSRLIFDDPNIPIENQLQLSDIGPEHLLLAACTFEVKKINQDRVIHVTFLAVRQCMRGRTLGRRLLAMVKDPIIVGQYQAVVVHADHNAVEFFRKYGFADDYVMNKKWVEFADQFTNCTLMTYLPPYMNSSSHPDHMSVELDLSHMERDISKWRNMVEDAHNQHFCLVQRLRQEVVYLRAQISSQDDIIKYLMDELRKSSDVNNVLEGNLLRSKFDFLRAKMEGVKLNESEEHQRQSDQSILDSIGRELELSLNTDPRTSILSNSNTTRWTVRGGKISRLPQLSVRDFERRAALPEFCERPRMKLYFCGGQEKPARLEELLSTGFRTSDFKDGTYGRGLYFAQHAATAALFSPGGRLLLCDVLLGQTESVSAACRSRVVATAGYHSVLCAGRSATGGGPMAAEAGRCTEYVIYHAEQVRPIALLDYTRETLTN